VKLGIFRRYIGLRSAGRVSVLSRRIAAAAATGADHLAHNKDRLDLKPAQANMLLTPPLAESKPFGQ